MSLLGKRWILQNQDSNKPTLQKILENRGFNDVQELENFHDPFLFNHMEVAVSRIHKAIKDQERIIVFGDYDVDGISGTAVLVQILQKLNAKVSYRIPHRVHDGYGLTAKFIPEFVEKDVKLVITVDCGISCHSEVLQASEQGVDIIVTDHHHIPEQIPEAAVAILHPKQADTKYPYPELTGSGVAFKLAHALILKNFPNKEQELLTELADLASLGTVADLGPLTGENRLIVKQGLKSLSQTKWAGLKQIMDRAKVEQNRIDASSIGFRIGPRINAAGRIGNPYTALSLLLQDSSSNKLVSLGQQLEELNEQRKQLTEEALKEAQIQIKQENPQELPPLLIAESPNWHVGIVGLVAGRLAERHGRPTIIMQEMENTFVASARSPEYFNITEALNHCSKHLTTYGGHAQAAGFSLKKEKLKAFKSAIQEYAFKKLKNQDLRSTLNLDCYLPNQEINFDLIDQIDDLKPFGVANEKPKFLVKNVEPLFIKQIGSQARHIKFKLQFSQQDVDVIGFSMGEFADDIRKHRKLDLACHLEKNHWNNKVFLQLQALDMRLHQG